MQYTDALLHIGDPVRFKRDARHPGTGRLIAANKKRATVERFGSRERIRTALKNVALWKAENARQK